MLRKLSHASTFKYSQTPFRSYQSLSCGWIYSSKIISSCWKLHHPQLLHLKSQVLKKKKNSIFETHCHTTLKKLCAWTSLKGAFVERKNSRPITSWHVTLPSPQDTANYKAPRIATRFCYHYSETNRNLPSVMQEPITP